MASEGEAQWRRRNCHVKHQSVVVCRIIEIGQHHILPDHQPEFVAEREELGALIGHGSADADHIHAGPGRRLQERLIGRPVARQVDDVGARPDGAAAEDRFAVDAQGKIPAVRAAIDGDPAKTGAAERMRPTVDRQRHRMQDGGSVACRPPGVDSGQTKIDPPDAVGVAHRCGRAARAVQHHLACQIRCDEGQRQMTGAGLIEIARQVKIVHCRAVLPQQADGAPGSDGHDIRAPARHEAECGGAQKPQALGASARAVPSSPDAGRSPENTAPVRPARSAQPARRGPRTCFRCRGSCCRSGRLRQPSPGLQNAARQGPAPPQASADTRRRDVPDWSDLPGRTGRHVRAHRPAFREPVPAVAPCPP